MGPVQGNCLVVASDQFSDGGALGFGSFQEQAPCGEEEMWVLTTVTGSAHGNSYSAG